MQRPLSADAHRHRSPLSATAVHEDGGTRRTAAAQTPLRVTTSPTPAASAFLLSGVSASAVKATRSHSRTPNIHAPTPPSRLGDKSAALGTNRLTPSRGAAATADRPQSSAAVDVRRKASIPAAAAASAQLSKEAASELFAYDCDPVRRQHFVVAAWHDTVVQNVTVLSEHGTCTEGRRALRSTGMLHTEGGWPRDLDVTDGEQVVRYRRRLEKEESYFAAIAKLCSTLSAPVKLNAAFDIYTVDLGEDPTDVASGESHQLATAHATTATQQQHHQRPPWNHPEITLPPY
jgi:hypothetical protein